MRKTKSEMLVTREHILDAALDCFLEKGYEAASLSEIAEMAGVTRGAVYWHFQDKQGLYRAVAELAMQRGDPTAAAYDLPLEMPLAERLEETFWTALQDTRYVPFLFLADRRTEQAEVRQQGQALKERVLHYFEDEVRVYIRLAHVEGKDAGEIAKALFLLFEGMLTVKHVPLELGLDRAQLGRYIRCILHMLQEDE